VSWKSSRIAINIEQQEDARRPCDLPAGGYQLDCEDDKVGVAGHVLGRRDEIAAAGHELLVGLGDPAAELMAPSERRALNELGTIGFPQLGHCRLAGREARFAPDSLVASNELVGRLLVDVGHRPASLLPAGVVGVVVHRLSRCSMLPRPESQGRASALTLPLGETP
jgi:hypothetical protein